MEEDETVGDTGPVFVLLPAPVFVAVEERLVDEIIAGMLNLNKTGRLPGLRVVPTSN